MKNVCKKIKMNQINSYSLDQLLFLKRRVSLFAS